MTRRAARFVVTAAAVALVGYGCSSTATSADAGADAAGPETTGQSCTAASQCYPGLDAAAFEGQVMCLDRVAGGYCTHLCTTDKGCCALAGECETGIKEVCSPFESTGQNMCFLSCEPEDLRPAPDGGAVLDESAYCAAYAGRDFKCRSSGGGSKNRKVCVPSGTSSDAGAGG